MSINSYRSKIEQLNQVIANLERDSASERKKIARLQNDISSIKSSITSSTSLSTKQSKERQINSKQVELAQSQEKLANIITKISQKVSELNRNLQNLERAEDQESKKQQAEAKRRRDEELQHTRKVTCEIQKQVQLQAQLKNSRLVIDLAKLPETITVLFIASNPIDQNSLRLDEEIRLITEKIRASEHRDSVNLVASWATRPGDLLQALNLYKPHIVHFSGHGSNNDELVFQADDGRTKLVSKEAIVTTMSTITDNIRVVLFNACCSDAQAKAVIQHVDVAIGMKDAINDDAARVFAAQLYSAIGFGRSIKQAFDQGIAALLLEGIPQSSTPKLFTHDGIDPDDVILVRPPIY